MDTLNITRSRLKNVILRFSLRLTRVGVGDNIYYSGGYGGDFYDDIYQWTGAAWEEVGKMKMARSYHAVSTIRLEDDASNSGAKLCSEFPLVSLVLLCSCFMSLLFSV